MINRSWKKNTGETPVDLDELVWVKRRNGDTERFTANCFVWAMDMGDRDITHWDYASSYPVEETSTLATQVGGDHYRDMTIQPWQAIEAWCSPEEVAGYHKATAIGYIAREQQKGGIEDIKKAIHHLQRLVEYAEQDDG